MTREIVTTGDILRINSLKTDSIPGSGTTYPERKDTYTDRLFKYIPAEIVAGYVFVSGVMNRLHDAGNERTLHWILLSVFCLLTPLYLLRVQKVMKVQQHIISLLSFLVWSFALGGPFSYYGWYNPLYGEILLPVFTLVVAVWEAK